MGSRVGVDLSARYIRLQQKGTGALSLAEVEILGPESNAVEAISPATVASELLAVDSDSLNPLLDQLGYFAFSADTYPAGLDVTETGTGVDLFFERPVGLDALLGYALELSPDLVTWTPIAIQTSPLETIRLEGVDSMQPDLRQHGFARIRVTVPATGETTTTKAVGWYRTTCHQGFQTHGISLNRAAFGTGRIISLNGTLQATVSNPMDLTNLGPAYMEIIDGAYEGHRIELQGITNNEDTALLQGTATGSTLATLSNEIIGASIMVRPHWTLQTAYPATDSTPNRDPASAAQILLFEDGCYRTFYSLAHPNRPYWTELGDDSLKSDDLEVIAPGHGIFLCQPDGEPHEVSIVGHVRDNLFQQRFAKGHHLVAQVYLIAQTPNQRFSKQSTGFQSASDPGSSDSIQLWQGNRSPAEEAFESYFYFSAPGEQSQPFWVRNADNTLASHNETALFQADRTAFI